MKFKSLLTESNVDLFKYSSDTLHHWSPKGLIAYNDTFSKVFDAIQTNSLTATLANNPHKDEIASISKGKTFADNGCSFVVFKQGTNPTQFLDPNAEAAIIYDPAKLEGLGNDLLIYNRGKLAADELEGELLMAITYRIPDAIVPRRYFVKYVGQDKPIELSKEHFGKLLSASKGMDSKYYHAYNNRIIKIDDKYEDIIRRAVPDFDKNWILSDLLVYGNESDIPGIKFSTMSDYKSSKLLEVADACRIISNFINSATTYVGRRTNNSGDRARKILKNLSYDEQVDILRDLADNRYNLSDDYIIEKAKEISDKVKDDAALTRLNPADCITYTDGSSLVKLTIKGDKELATKLARIIHELNSRLPASYTTPDKYYDTVDRNLSNIKTTARNFLDKDPTDFDIRIVTDSSSDQSIDTTGAMKYFCINKSFYANAQGRQKLYISMILLKFPNKKLVNSNSNFYIFRVS